MCDGDAKNTATSSSQTSAPEWLTNTLGSYINRANTQSQQPYTPFNGQRAADLNETQVNAINKLYNATNYQAPQTSSASTSAAMGAATNSPTAQLNFNAANYANAPLQAAQSQGASAQAANLGFNAANYTSAPGVAAQSQAATSQGGKLSNYFNPANYQASPIQAAQAQAAQSQVVTSQGANLGNYFNASTNSLGTNSLSNYMNPYQQSVINSTLGEIDRGTTQNLQQAKGNAALAGAFGGDRAAIQETEIMRNADQLKANTAANLNAQNFSQAQNAANQDINRALQAGTTQSGLDQTNSGLNAQLALQNNQYNAAAQNANNQFNANSQNAINQFNTNTGLQNANLALQAGTTQAGLDQTNSALNAQLGTQNNQANANALNNMTQFNTNAGLQAGNLALQGANAQAGYNQQANNLNAQLALQNNQYNANSQNATNQFNTNAALNQGNLALQAANAQAGYAQNANNLNAQLGTQASLQNANNQTQTQLANVSAENQIRLANMNAALQGAQLGLNATNQLFNAGTQQQNTTQNANNAAYQDYLQQQQYPWQQLANATSITGGVMAPFTGQTTTQTGSSSPSGLQTVSGLGTLGIGIGSLVGKNGLTSAWNGLTSLFADGGQVGRKKPGYKNGGLMGEFDEDDEPEVEEAVAIPVAAPAMALPIGNPAAPTQVPFRERLRGAESGGRDGVVNRQGYSGRYQFGAPRLAELGLYTPQQGSTGNNWGGTFNIPGFENVRTQQDFLANPAAQDAAYEKHERDIDRAIAATPGADRFDRDGLRSVAHLGGVTGMRRWIETGGKYNPSDANGTSLTDYYQRFTGGGNGRQQVASADGSGRTPLSSVQEVSLPDTRVPEGGVMGNAAPMAAAESDDPAARRSRDNAMALITAGLGILGGTGSGVQAIGQGGLKGIQYLQQARQEERQERQLKNEADYRNEMLGTRRTANDIARQRAGIQERAAAARAQPVSEEEIRAAGGDPTTQTGFRDASGAVRLQNRPLTMDQRLALARAGAQPGAETEFGKTYGKGAGEQLVALETAGDSASGTLGMLNQAEAALNEITTGQGTGTQVRIGSLAQKLGLPQEALSGLGLDANTVAAGEQLQAISSRLLSAAIGPGGFPANNFSDADRRALERANVNVDNSTEGNRRLIAIERAKAERAQQLSDAWRNYRAEEGRKPESERRGLETLFQDFNRDVRPGIVRQAVITPLVGPGQARRQESPARSADAPAEQRQEPVALTPSTKREDLRQGQSYRLRDGRVGRWNGSGFDIVQ